jgi:membrane-associated protease RseP (regulator of RpoE activity)
MKCALMTLLLVAGLAGSSELLRAGDKTARPKEAYLGLGVESVPPALASHLPGVLPPDQGVLVGKVAKDSPAGKAGLQPNDILLSYGDQKLYSPEQLVKLVRSDKPGHEVAVHFVRGGKSMACKVTLGEAPAAEVPTMPDRTRIFRFLPDERFRKLFEEMESKFDQSAWDHLDSFKLSRLDAKRWKAEVEHRTNKGEKVSKVYTGTRDEIRKAIQAEKDLPADERDRLLRALNLQNSAFEFHFPPFGPIGPAPKNQP